ncbi:PucR family transcriptional regulator [Specibacter cremeus]|uniref:PucR family transcriptional regulator n=1 Tax=Specibacter cremeus TaxID=1629051 RepID=UPI000F78AC62|nr:helix-turn-helix domain-containing protein [Specibacter cremeus]
MRATHPPLPGHTAGAGATLAGLQRRLGATLLRFDAPLPAAPRTVTGVWLAESGGGPLADLAEGMLVLAPGRPEAAELDRLLADLARARAAGVVLHASVRPDPALLERTLAAGVAVLGLAEGASWLRLAAVLQSVTVGEAGPGADAPEGVAPDLFDVANSVAAIIGGPVTIENLDSRILAFSADQAAADEARKQSVLGHQVPAEYSRLLRSQGAFKAIYDSSTPVFLPSIGPGIRPRVGMRIRAGSETVGSIWAVVDAPLDPHRDRALTEAADMVALSMLRVRTAADAAARLRYGLVVMLLEGGAPAEEAAARIGFAAHGVAVLAAGLHGVDAGTAEGEAELDRVAGAMGLHLDTVNPLSVTARIGGRVYGVLPVPRRGFGTRTGAAAGPAGARSEGPPAAEHGADPVRRAAENLVARLGRDTLAVGLGAVVSSAGRLNRSRAEADSALRVLLARSPGPARTRVAAGADVQVEALMMRLADMLAAGREEVSGPLAVLAAHDRDHAGDLVATLAAWLDAFGDVTAAAAAVHVHQNTFRYRLRKLCEIGGIDPTDPDQRFALLLQLRLFGGAR